MKKTFLTLVAVGFGVSVSFAQTTAPAGSGMDQNQVQTEQPGMTQQDENKKEVQMSELPSAVQDAFKNGQYSDYQVIAIYEKEGEEGKKYAFELAQNSSAEQGAAAADGMEGVETQRVSDRKADIVVLFDENGQVLEEKEPEEKKQK